MKQHMNFPLRILTLFMILFLFGCTPWWSSSPVPTPSNTAEPTRTATPRRAPIITSTTQTPIPSIPTQAKPTQTRPFETGASDPIQKKCLTLAPTRPVEAQIEGSLVLAAGRGFQDELLDLASGERITLPDDRNCFATSPDGNWLACTTDGFEFLTFASADGQIKTKFPLQSYETKVLLNPWLGPELYSFSLLPPSGALPVVAVNPRSGKWQILYSDYPGLEPYDGGWGGFRNHFTGRSVAYDPTLRLVVYPKTEEGDEYIVLWDREARKALASIRHYYYFGNNPIWTPDGEYVFVDIANQTTDTQLQEELYQISRTGEVTQLTHFMDYFKNTNIMLDKASPDGNRVVFWWTREFPTTTNSSWRMVVLNRTTQEMVDYCVTDLLGGSSWVSFSPDGQFVAVTLDRSPQDQTPRVIVIDTVEEWAFIAAESASLIGWWNTP